MFDLLLRGRDHGMGEALAEVHRHQSDDLHRFAGAGRLFDQHGIAGSAHVGDEMGLVWTKRFAGCGVQGGFSGQAETQEYFTRNRTTAKGPLDDNRRERSSLTEEGDLRVAVWRSGGVAA